MPATTIRPANPDDAATILRFIRDLAAYEEAAHEVSATEESVRATLSGPNAKAFALIAQAENAPVGFAVYFFSYSTWQAQYGLYLEDLYVMPEYRGHGAGKALMKALARIAVEEDCGRFEWSVLDWNEPAIKVYESIGARAQPEWVRYRMTGDRLTTFAES